MQAMNAIKRAIILLRFDWLTGLIGALLWCFEVANARFSVLPRRVICSGGAEVVRRMASHNFRGFHDEIQIEIQVQSLHSLGCTNDQQI
jgi:hypothetical protein